LFRFTPGSFRYLEQTDKSLGYDNDNMNWAGIVVNAINNSLQRHVMNATSTLKHFPAQSNKIRRNDN